MERLVEFLVCAAILGGAVFVLIGSIGLARLPDFYQRLHGPTKASTLGVGAIVIGCVLFFSWKAQAPQLQTILVALFLMITAPVSAHMLAKAAMHRDLPRRPGTRGRPWKQ